MLALLPVQSAELEERNEIYSYVIELLGEGDFTELYYLANDFILDESRTNSGTWKISHFYNGVQYFTFLAGSGQLDLKQKEDFFEQWIKKKPGSPQSYIAKARFHFDRATISFGDRGWAGMSQVQKSQFDRQLKKAQELLNAAKNFTAMNDPHWYVVQADVKRLMLVAEQEFMNVIHEGLSKHPTYLPIHSAAVAYLTPNWKGSKKRIEDFASSVDKTAALHSELGLYARIYWLAAQYDFGYNLRSASDINWSKMRKAMLNVIAAYPSPWNIQHFALFACHAGDLNTTNQLLAMVNDNIDTMIWTEPEVIHRCRGV